MEVQRFAISRSIGASKSNGLTVFCGLVHLKSAFDPNLIGLRFQERIALVNIELPLFPARRIPDDDDSLRQKVGDQGPLVFFDKTNIFFVPVISFSRL